MTQEEREMYAEMNRDFVKRCKESMKLQKELDKENDILQRRVLKLSKQVRYCQDNNITLEELEYREAKEKRRRYKEENNIPWWNFWS